MTDDYIPVTLCHWPGDVCESVLRSGRLLKCMKAFQNVAWCAVAVFQQQLRLHVLSCVLVIENNIDAVAALQITSMCKAQQHSTGC